MNGFYSILLTCAAFFGLILASCISDDFSDSPDAPLIFSSDNVDFGTVFTDLRSPTARLVVRNPDKKGVVLSRIRFEAPDSPFMLNVDGVSGTEFSDVEIRGNDSIYLFIECFIRPDSSAEPWKVADRLLFSLNGSERSVGVEATALNVSRLRDLSVSSDLTLTPERPYVVFGDLRVEPGATLTILPGTDLLFHDGAGITVEGSLIACGEPGRLINLRGDRLDNVLPDVAYDIMAGQWRGITLAKGSFGNRLEYVDMRSTSEGLRADSCADLSRSKLTLLNCWLHNSQSTVLRSEFARIDAYGCCFSEAAGAVVSLKGGSHEFLQCTIANNYLFSAVAGANLTLLHCLPAHAADSPLPLMKAVFGNGIIWGLGSPLNEGKLDGSDVVMRNMLIKADGSDDAAFINCIWNKDPMFLTVRQDYYFNYHVMPESPAVGAADPALVAPFFSTDIDGIDRLSGGAPVLGAYARPESPQKP